MPITAEGNFIETVSGRRIAIPNTDPKQIDIYDIAHALSYQPRFAGHTSCFYSVAEHSLNVARLVTPEHRFQALLHDATEAYLCDIPTPYKIMMPEYKKMEHSLWTAIAERFNLDPELSVQVKHADAVMLMTERDALKPFHGHWGEREAIPRCRLFRKRHNNNLIKDEFLLKFFQYGGVA